MFFRWKYQKKAPSWRRRIYLEKRTLALFERYFEAGVALYDEHAFLRVAAADE